MESEGFEAWYEMSYPSVLACVVAALGDLDIGEDATAEGFARALERWERVSRMASPAGWTFRVAVNHGRRANRRRSIERRLTLRFRPRNEVDHHISIEPALWEAVRRLPRRQRVAIALRYLEDMTQADVAEAMAVAPGTAAATLTSARRHLRVDLQEDPDAVSR